VATTASSSDALADGVAHVGIVVDDLEAAMADLPVVGAWSSVLEWETTVRHSDGSNERRPVRFVTATGAPAHVKLIESAPGSIWAPTGGVQQLHHLTYWVADLEAATAHLHAEGYRTEADGLEDDGCVRFRYLLSPLGLRVELGLLANKSAFDSWAAGGDHA
jgi:hypothetical protein